jgi:hypothetical protein
MKKTLGRFAVIAASAAIVFGAATGTASASGKVFIDHYDTEGACEYAALTYRSGDQSAECSWNRAYTHWDLWTW